MTTTAIEDDINAMMQCQRVVIAQAALAGVRFEKKLHNVYNNVYAKGMGGWRTVEKVFAYYGDGQPVVLIYNDEWDDRFDDVYSAACAAMDTINGHYSEGDAQRKVLEAFALDPALEDRG